MESQKVIKTLKQRKIRPEVLLPQEAVQRGPVALPRWCLVKVCSDRPPAPDYLPDTAAGGAPCLVINDNCLLHVEP